MGCISKRLGKSSVERILLAYKYLFKEQFQITEKDQMYYLCKYVNVLLSWYRTLLFFTITKYDF